jgi:hypothetical protein
MTVLGNSEGEVEGVRRNGWVPLRVRWKEWEEKGWVPLRVSWKG